MSTCAISASAGDVSCVQYCFLYQHNPPGQHPKQKSAEDIRGIMDSAHDSDKCQQQAPDKKKDTCRLPDAEKSHSYDRGRKYMAAGHGFSFCILIDQRGYVPCFIGTRTVNPPSDYSQQYKKYCWYCCDFYPSPITIP